MDIITSNVKKYINKVEYRCLSKTSSEHSIKSHDSKEESKAESVKINSETKKILTNLTKWESEHENFKRILVVTHGGYIMEFYNTVKEINGQKICNDNNAKN